MKFLFIILTIFSVLFAQTNQDNLPPSEFLITNGTNSKTNVPSMDDNINRENISQNIPVAPKTKATDYSNAMIFQAIKKNSDKYINGASRTNNFLIAPKTFIEESMENNTALADNDNIKKTKKHFLILKCFSVKDYKIYSSINFETVCYDEFNDKFKLFSRLEISKNKQEMKVSPYLLETVENKKIFIDSKKSRLYNGLSGSDNLATYIDKRAIEGIAKAMGGTIGNETGKLTKDYLSQKNKANTAVITNDNGNTQTTTTQTTNPEPKVEDYGIALLIDTLSAGLKAGTDMLYRDLGYIYYIPKNSIFNAEIFYED